LPINGTAAGEYLDVSGGGWDVGYDVLEQAGFSAGPTEDRFGIHIARDFYAARRSSSRFFTLRKSIP